MINRTISVISALALWGVAGTAFAADGCAYRGVSYAPTSVICQLDLQYRCDAGRWVGLQIRCPENVAGTGLQRCDFNGTAYSAGAAVCQSGYPYRCDAGVWIRLGGTCAGNEVSSPTVISGVDAADALRVIDVRANDRVVTGLLLNSSQRPVRDVELLVRHTWLWNNEVHPGDDSPGRADYYTIRAEIPPRQEIPFTYRVSPPLPQRDDGRFRTSVQVAGFTQIGE
jgi:hypothetical protein